MNVAIVGKSQANSILKECLVSEGFTPFLFESVNDILDFSGEKLNYTLRTSKDRVNAGYVIVTEGLATEGVFSNLDRFASSNAPIAFILDYPSESPAHITAQALENAVKLAKRKKTVIYMSRFIRTAGNMAEHLYKEARNSGVTFIKYTDISVDYDSDCAIYSIEATDGYEKISIETPSALMFERNGNTDALAKILRLKQSSDKLINEDRSFLFPSHTNRDGVYFLSSASLSDKDEALKHIEFTVEEIKREVHNIYKDSVPSLEVPDMPVSFIQNGTPLKGVYAEVDAGKCAFCYTCFRACPHSAMAPDYENSVMKNLNNSCQACGICVSVCPADAVRLIGRQAGNEEFESATLKILCCENSGSIAVNRLKNELDDIFDKVEVVPVSCGGELSVELITSSLKNYEKVLVITCMDEACKHFEGNKRAEKFVNKVKEMLTAAGMDASRVECLKASHAMPYVVWDQIREMI
jgi:Pyruvate/2-oxoacid:ferredoxin oxidoreductase delta subunit/coenzyme F420-reducing hydrogenase delta subunit